MESIFESVRIFLLSNQDYAWLYLIVIKIVGSILLVPGSILTLLAGSLLGKLEGTIVSLVGNTIGAVCAFVISRYFFRDLVESTLLTKYPKINEYDSFFFKKGFTTMLFLRLVPLFPFNALNYLMGVTKITFKDYFLGTLIGIIPGTFAYVYLGESLRYLSFVNILFALVAIVILSFVGKVWKLK